MTRHPYTALWPQLGRIDHPTINNIKHVFSEGLACLITADCPDDLCQQSGSQKIIWCRLSRGDLGVIGLHKSCRHPWPLAAIWGAFLGMTGLANFKIFSFLQASVVSTLLLQMEALAGFGGKLGGRLWF